ncbi:MAG TPA: DUF433 domain-containing protein [Isosphaeraceae bacterium]|jgi:uncharacterized protein (DUF433 family)
MATVAYAHIELNKDGKPIVSGTRTKVVMIARDRIAGDDAEQIQRRYPYLSLGQIHSALAYYYDHKEEMDRSIEEADRLVEEMRSAQGESPLARKLKEQGLFP